MKKRMNRGKLLKRDLEIITTLGLVFGYLDVGIIEVDRAGFTFTVRGPLFWRWSAGLPPYLHRPSTGIAKEAYLRIEAMLAYLLLTGDAYVGDATVAASTMVWTVHSPYFKWEKLQSILQDEGAGFRSRRALMMLFNTAIGVGLCLRKLPLVITAVAYDTRLMTKFYVSAAPLQRTARRLPSKLTLPQMSRQLYGINVIVGALMIAQQIQAYGVAVERGGLIGFSISGNVLRYHYFPRLFRRLTEAWASHHDESQDD